MEKQWNLDWRALCLMLILHVKWFLWLCEHSKCLHPNCNRPKMSCNYVSSRNRRDQIAVPMTGQTDM